MTTTRRLSFAAAALCLPAAFCFCSRNASEPAPPSGAGRLETPARAATSAEAAMPDPCTLVTAEEVGAALKRMLVSSRLGPTCEYGNAPDAVDLGSLTNVTLDLSRDDMTEAQIKGIYTQTGKTVRRSLDPDSKGLPKTIAVANDIPHVGDWAFTTNVAAVNMGFGFSSRGRILHARKGPWHLTVGATISPDPGEAAMDEQLAGIARTAIARLP